MCSYFLDRSHHDTRRSISHTASPPIFNMYLLFVLLLHLHPLVLSFRIESPWKPSRPSSVVRLHQQAASSLSNGEISRYSRHLVLSDVGMKGQLNLRDSSVLVIGAGGLGSPCLLYLAAAGVGHIGIVDGDVVDESNLQRQVIHGTSTIGVSKCQSAAQRIHDINPYVKVRLYEEELTSETAMRIVGEGFSEDRPWDIVVDGSDNFPTKYLIK